MAVRARGILTRRAILEAAGEIFDECGYPASTLDMVYERAGVSKGALFHHFRSKRDLAQAVLDAQIPQAMVPSQPCKMQEIVDISFNYARLLLSNPLVRGGTRLATDHVAVTTDGHTDLFSQWVELAQSLLEQAHAQGELQPGVVLSDTAELMIGAFAGVQVLSRSRTRRKDLEHRFAVMWDHILPTVVTTDVWEKIDIAPDRGARVAAAH